MLYLPTTFEDGQVLTGPQLTAEFAKLPAALAETDGAGRVVTSDGRTVQAVLDAATPAADLASSVAGKGAELVHVDDGATGSLWTTVAGFVAKIISSGASVIGFIQSGIGAVRRTIEEELRSRPASPYQFGAVGDGVADDYPALQAALTASLCVDLGDGVFKTSAALTATVHHQITGRGFSRTQINPTHSGFVLEIAAPVSDTRASLLLDQFTINGKNGVSVGGTRVSHAVDGAIIGGKINVCVIGTYSAGSGDAAYDTDKVRDTGNALVSSNTGTALSARKTFDDIEAYGVGIRLSKCMDTVLEYPQFYGCGVSVALIGSDLIKWRGGRSHEVGLFFYSERIGAWGSQAELRGVDLLHNRRAGGILLNSTKFDRVDDCYYECYSDSALMVFAESTEGVIIDDNRIDDPYYTGGGGTASGTTPVMLFNIPFYNNKVRSTRFQKFSDFSVPVPSVRIAGSLSAIDSNHTEAVAIEPASGYVPIRYKEVLFGMRYGDLDPSILTPNNVAVPFAGGVSPLAVLDGAQYVFFNASSLFPTARFDIDPVKTGYTLRANAKVVSGTTLYLSITHNGYDGTTLETLFASTIGGFATAAYSTQTQSLALTVPPAQGDYLLVTWQSNSAYVTGLRLE